MFFSLVGSEADIGLSSRWRGLYVSFTDKVVEAKYQVHRKKQSKAQDLFLCSATIVGLGASRALFLGFLGPIRLFYHANSLGSAVLCGAAALVFRSVPRLLAYWDALVLVGALHFMAFNSLSHGRVAQLLGQAPASLSDENFSSSGEPLSCNIDISAFALAVVGLVAAAFLLDLCPQRFFFLAGATPLWYMFASATASPTEVDLTASAAFACIQLGILGAILFLAVAFRDQDQRRLFRLSQLETSNISLGTSDASVRSVMAEAGQESSIGRMMRATFDVCFLVTVSSSKDSVKVTYPCSALNDLLGKPMEGVDLASVVSKDDRDRFADYIKQLDVRGPANLLPVLFEPTEDFMVAVDLYIAGSDSCTEYIVGLKLNQNPSSAMPLPGLLRGSSDLSNEANMTPGLMSRSGSGIRSPDAERQKHPELRGPPSICSAPAVVIRDSADSEGDESRTAGCTSGDCLPSDSLAWVEGHTMMRKLCTIEPGERVLCHDKLSGSLKYATVRDVTVERGAAEWVLVELSDGTVLRMTTDHPVRPDRNGAKSPIVRAGDLQADRDSLVCLKATPVLVRSVSMCLPQGESQSDTESVHPSRVYLTVQQAERHAIFVAAPGSKTEQAGVSTMAVGSADLKPQTPADGYMVKNTFVHCDDSNTMRFRDQGRSNSAPSRVLAAPERQSASNDPKERPQDIYAESVSGASKISSKVLSDGSQCSSVISTNGESIVHIGGQLAPLVDEVSGAVVGVRPATFASSAVKLSSILALKTAGMRSIGSCEHASGECKVCLFENRRRHNNGPACYKGVTCDRCHEDHDPFTAPTKAAKPRSARAVNSRRTTKI